MKSGKWIFIFVAGIYAVVAGYIVGIHKNSPYVSSCAFVPKENVLVGAAKLLNQTDALRKGIKEAATTSPDHVLPTSFYPLLTTINSFFSDVIRSDECYKNFVFKLGAQTWITHEVKIESLGTDRPEIVAFMGPVLPDACVQMNKGLGLEKRVFSQIEIPPVKFELYKYDPLTGDKTINIPDGNPYACRLFKRNGLSEFYYMHTLLPQ